MKKFIIFIFLLFVLLKTQSQNYLIGFSSTGDTTVVATVKVTNLSNGETLTMNGNDTLHLYVPNGIDSYNIYHGNLQIYPNPMTEETILTFVAPENGDAIISIIDLSGKTLCQKSVLLSAGVHRFRVSGMGQGISFIIVTGKNYNYSAKVISQRVKQSSIKIEYVSTDINESGNLLKSNTLMVSMSFTNGDTLLFKGVSGIYSTIVTNVPDTNETITFNFVACTDIESNNYSTVTIGSQIWMAENLNAGNFIPDSQSPVDDTIIEKYCYDDDVNNCSLYGGLYQWNEMMQYDTAKQAQGICPEGWHIPSQAAWDTLFTYLGGGTVAGGFIKEKGYDHWLSPNTGATNVTGFTALPAGYRYYSGGFNFLSKNAYFWSRTQSGTNYSWSPVLYYNKKLEYKGCSSVLYSFSVRCLHN